MTRQEIGLYVDRIQDVLVDFPRDTEAQRKEIRMVLADAIHRAAMEQGERIIQAIEDTK